MQARHRPTQERPDGPLSGLMYEYDCRVEAAGMHAAAEGHSVGVRHVLESYDRTLHPWMHGRRPSDLATRYGDQIEALGFATGLLLAIPYTILIWLASGVGAVVGIAQVVREQGVVATLAAVIDWWWSR